MQDGTGLTTIRALQAIGMHLLNMLQEEGFKKLCGNSYPSSTSFLTFEKVVRKTILL